jgi:hypothetical protein
MHAHLFGRSILCHRLGAVPAQVLVDSPLSTTTRITLVIFHMRHTNGTHPIINSINGQLCKFIFSNTGINAFCGGCRPSVSGGDEYMLDQWRLGEFPCERVFAASSADEEDTQQRWFVVFHVLFSFRRENSLDSERLIEERIDRGRSDVKKNYQRRRVDCKIPHIPSYVSSRYIPIMIINLLALEMEVEEWQNEA